MRVTMVDQDQSSSFLITSLPDGKGLAFSAEGGVSDILCQVLVSP